MVSAGANGEVVQWQAYFVDPPLPPFNLNADNPETSNDGQSNSLVGAINASRNRKEKVFQRSNTNPRSQRVRHVGHDPPTGDGRPGGVDAFEMDYRTTLAREDFGEFSFSGLVPSGAATGRKEGGEATGEAGDKGGVEG